MSLLKAMVMIVDTVTTAVSSELFSCIWSEAALFSFAILAYLSFTNGLHGLKPQEKTLALGGKGARLKTEVKGNHATYGGSSAKDNSTLQQISKILRQGGLTEATSLLSELPVGEQGELMTILAPRFLVLAAKASEPRQVASLLNPFVESIEPIALEVAIMEAQKRKDMQACVHLDCLSGLLCIQKSQRAFEVLARTYSSDPAALRRLMQEAGTPLKKPFAKAVLEACATMKDADLVVEVFERSSSADTPALRAFAEQTAAAVADNSSEISAGGWGPSKDMTGQATEIRALGRAGDLPGAIALFGSLPSVTGKAGTLLLNAIIDACVEGGNMDTARAYLVKGQQSGVADGASINTVVKGLLAVGEETAASQLLEELSSIAPQHSRSSYNALLHVRVLAENHHGAWRLYEEMRAASIAPNAATCSILLQLVKTSAHAEELSRAMAAIDALQAPMDEALLSSLLEACLRAGRLDLLSRALARNTRRGGGLALTAPMYGSMVKAFGQARDVARVWSVWHEMRARQVQPTAITLGCMVEALVQNCRTEDAWQLVQETWEDEAQRHLVNTVTYSTLLKGLSKEPGRVMAMYEEMRARGVECNTITYNTILNVFAQCRAMHRVPPLLADMKAASPPVEPDAVTYATLIKGFCASGSLDRAFGLLEELKQMARFAPDERMYNSLLDGCAREQRLQEALQLIDEMRTIGVPPSNYTLSVLVKLLGRCKKLGQAFASVEALSSEFGFRPNIQVYTCLMQACFHNRQPAKAVALLDRLLHEGLQPDETTYTALARGLLQAGQPEQAARMVRRAYQDGPPVGVDAQCLKAVAAKLGSGMSEVLLAEVGASHQRCTGGARTVGVRATRGRGAGSDASSGASGTNGPLPTGRALPVWREGAQH